MGYVAPVFASAGSSAPGGGGMENFELPSFSGGSNQYSSYPSMGGYGSSSYMTPGVGQQMSSSFTPSGAGGSTTYGGGFFGGGTMTEPSLDPALTGALGGYLQSQVGQGVSPFNLSALLPSTGQATQPGQLTAGLNPLMQQLMSFFQGQGPGVTGSASPGGGASSSPLSYVLPMFQSEMGAMNIPIQNQLANIKEQFGSMGALGSSEMANAMGTYGAQTAADQESLLGQLTMQALPQEMSMASGLQQIDQSSIDRLVQQFQTDLPQNNPLMQEMYGMSTTFAPTTQKGGNALGGLFSALPGLGGSIYEGLSGGGGLSGLGSSLAGMGLAM